MNSMRLVRLGGKTYVVGVDWQPPDLDGDPDGAPLARSGVAMERAAQAARRMALRPPDMMAVHGRQCGHCDSEGAAGAFKGRHALAGRLSLPGPSFLGLLPMVDVDGRSFWWVLAKVGEELIGGESDRVHDSEREAGEAFESLGKAFPGGFAETRRFGTAPESQAFLEDRLLPSSWWRGFRNVEDRILPLGDFEGRGGRTLKRWTLATALLAAALYALDAGTDFWNASRFSEATRLKEAERTRLRLDHERHPERLFPQAWIRSPMADEVCAACLGAVAETPVSVGGWLLERVACTPEGRKVTVVQRYAHGGGASYAGTDLVPDPREARRASRTLQRPLPEGRNPARIPGLEGLRDMDRIRTDFLQLAQTLGLRASLKPKAPVRRTVPEVGTFVCPWREAPLELTGISTRVMGSGLGDLLGTIPGLVVEDIVYEGANWNMRGRVYVTR
ncbi:MAG: type 4b pilus protein PilO2 [Desulfovibrio sp.]|jgi:hypothetical protein|nr:type 4b pilus protein PilO2 [Desulfovibrio sp.]